MIPLRCGGQEHELPVVRQSVWDRRPLAVAITWAIAYFFVESLPVEGQTQPDLLRISIKSFRSIVWDMALFCSWVSVLWSV